MKRILYFLLLLWLVITQPYCKNSGRKRTNGDCECIQGFTGLQCLNKTCENSGELNNKNHCMCDEDWAGSHCLSCVDDDSCVEDGKPKCDRSLITQTEKYVSCKVVDEDIANYFGNQINMHCKAVENKNNTYTCGIQVWTNSSLVIKGGAYTQVFYCDLDECSIRLSNTEEGGRIINYDCTNTQCECVGPPDKCNPQVSTIINHLSGESVISCIGDNSAHCKMKQKGFPWDIPFQCSAGECVAIPSNETIAPPPPFVDFMGKHIVAFIIGPVLTALFLLFISITCCVSCCHTKKANKEYKTKLMDKVIPSIETNNLSYIVGGRKIPFIGTTIGKVIMPLIDINLNIRPEKDNDMVVAVIGKSGAGKSTLLDIIANRTKSGSIHGQVLINGSKFDNSYTRISGYVTSDNFFSPDLTVKETLMFCAESRLPGCITYKEKTKRVENVMIDMELTRLANSRVGDKEKRGISQGEKKRLAIAMELIVEPNILILDEPTTGLDHTGALAVCKKLVDISSENRIIIYSIHQPSMEIWNHGITHVLLLARGKEVWFGKKENMIKTIGNADPKHIYQIGSNPANYAVEYLQKLQSKSISNIEKITTIIKKEKPKLVNFNLIDDDDIKEDAIEMDTYEENNILLHDTYLKPGKETKLMRYATSFWTQFYVLTKRNFKVFFRNVLLAPLHFVLAVVIGVGLGLLYFNLSYDMAACQSRIGIIYFITLILSLSPLGSLDIFIKERYTYKNEVARGYYKSSAYFLSKILFDLIPLRIVPSIVMGTICYFMVGLKSGFYHYAWFIVIITLVNCVSSLICIALSSLSSNMGLVSVLFIYGQLFGTLFGGLFINNHSSSVYTSWIHYGSFWNYALEALLINEFHDTEVLINPKGLPGLNITVYGDFYLSQFGMDATHVVRDIGILFGITAVLLALSGVLLRFLVKEKS